MQEAALEVEDESDDARSLVDPRVATRSGDRVKPARVDGVGWRALRGSGPCIRKLRTTLDRCWTLERVKTAPGVIVKSLRTAGQWRGLRRGMRT